MRHQHLAAALLLLAGSQPALSQAPIPEPKTFGDFKDKVTAVGLSPDGKVLAAASWDKSIKLWDLETGKETKLRNVNDAWVMSMAFSPDGKTLAYGDFQSRIHLYNVEKSKPISMLGTNAAVHGTTTLGFSADSKLLFAGSSNKESVAFDITAPPIREVLRFTSAVVNTTRLAVSSDGKVATTGWESRVHVYNIATKKRLTTLYNDLDKDGDQSVAFRSDGKILAAGGWGKTIHLWDFSGELPLATLQGHAGPISALVFRPGSNLLIAADSSGGIRLWDIGAKKVVAEIKVGAAVGCLALSADGKSLAAGCQDKTVRLYDLAKIEAPALGKVAGNPGRKRPPEDATIVYAMIEYISPPTDIISLRRAGERSSNWHIEPKKWELRMVIEDKEVEPKDFKIRDFIEVRISKRDQRVIEVRLVGRVEGVARRAEAFNDILRKSYANFGVRVYPTKKSAPEALLKIDAEAVPQVLELIDEAPSDDLSFDLLKWVLTRSDPELKTKAAERVLAHQLKNAGLLEIIADAVAHARDRAAAVDKLLKSEAPILAKAQGTRAAADETFLEAGSAGDPALTSQAEKLYGLLAKDFGKLNAAGRFGPETMADYAEARLVHLQSLWPGKPAPDINGKDVAGKRFKLSDFQGKVVFVRFWHSAFLGQKKDKFEVENALLKRFEGKPFVCLAVCLDEDRGRLRKRVEANEVTWPAWWDGEGKAGPIARRWRLLDMEASYVVDAQGTIRRKGHEDVEELAKSIEGLMEKTK